MDSNIVLISYNIAVVGCGFHDCLSHVSFVTAPYLVLLLASTSYDGIPNPLGYVGHCTALDPFLLFLAPRAGYHDHDAQ